LGRLVGNGNDGHVLPLFIGCQLRQGSLAGSAPRRKKEQKVGSSACFL
jgi:hypothetical protein